MKERTIFSVFCSILILAALAVTLFNTSAFASLFEPSPWLAWAWAIYVDLALAGYTVAHVWLKARNMRTGVVRFGFYWFICLSLIANVVVILSRYDVTRGADLIAGVRNSVQFMYVVCILYGASIPLSVFTFAHTIADAFTRVQERTESVQACTESVQDGTPAVQELSTRDKVRAMLRTIPTPSVQEIAQALQIKDATVRRYAKEPHGD
jgi:hypothetical protein